MPLWSMYLDCTVFPVWASVRTAPDSKPAAFKKTFPEGLRTPWAQFVYVPIGKVAVSGSTWHSGRTTRGWQPAKPRARSAVKHAFMAVLHLTSARCPRPGFGRLLSAPQLRSVAHRDRPSWK